jgi:type II secretory pathway component GspD/PulD (secretin)
MSRTFLVRFALAAALAAAAVASPAQNALEIIELRHRLAEQVLPALQPLVEPGGTLAGQGSRLFVRTSPANLAELRRALAALDRPAERLRISVRFDDSLDASRRSLGASGRIGSDGADVELRARDSRSSSGERVDQTVQVLEGARATIYTGESRPVRERRYIQTPAGVVSQEITVVQETTTGFDVVPRLVGSRVQIDIASANGATTASGPLGEWFELGAIAEQDTRASAGLASSASRASAGTRRVWIKVERLP